MFDETSDKSGKAILNVLVSPLSNLEYIKPVVIWSNEISETTADTVFNVIIKILEPLISDQKFKGNFKALITDGAAYCKKVGKLVKEKHGDVIQIICLCHNLHNLQFHKKEI